MSRCFPYPPPGYTVSSARKEALIDSIKLQKKETVKSDDQGKKEKRREKKEKRKDEKRKDKKNKTHSKHEKLGSITGHIGEKESMATDKKKDLLQKGSKAEAEQLERSSVTEELGEPLRLPCASSDSTENSNKRKRHSAEPVDCIRGHGKIIRIRLSKKPNQTDASANEQQQVCSTSGRADLPTQNIDDINLRQTKSNGISNTYHVLPLEISKEQVCSSSKQMKLPAISVKDSVMSPMQRIALQYKNLTENCTLPPLEIVSSSADDDLDWLFQGKNQGEKRRVCRNDGLSCSSSLMLWPPRAQHLPEVDVYALPYTIPF